jgi:hypothetical protein
MNPNFGKVKSDNSLEYAPDAVRNGGRIILHPNAIGYATADDGPWLPIVDEPPNTPPREGYHWERTRPVEEGGEIRWQYAEVADPPPPPRVFRRSWLAQWIRAAGRWDAFAAFLADPAAADLAFLWEYCTEFDEDNASWPAALAAIKTALALTDAEAEAMLGYGATGGQP